MFTENYTHYWCHVWGAGSGCRSRAGGQQEGRDTTGPGLRSCTRPQTITPAEPAGSATRRRLLLRGLLLVRDAADGGVGRAQLTVERTREVLRRVGGLREALQDVVQRFAPVVAHQLALVLQLPHGNLDQFDGGPQLPGAAGEIAVDAVRLARVLNTAVLKGADEFDEGAGCPSAYCSMLSVIDLVLLGGW